MSKLLLLALVVSFLVMRIYVRMHTGTRTCHGIVYACTQISTDDVRYRMLDIIGTDKSPMRLRVFNIPNVSKGTYVRIIFRLFNSEIKSAYVVIDGDHYNAVIETQPDCQNLITEN